MSILMIPTALVDPLEADLTTISVVRNGSFYITKNGKVISGAYTNQGNARNAASKLAADLKKRGV